MPYLIKQNKQKQITMKAEIEECKKNTNAIEAIEMILTHAACEYYKSKKVIDAIWNSTRKNCLVSTCSLL